MRSFLLTVSQIMADGAGIAPAGVSLEVKDIPAPLQVHPSIGPPEGMPAEALINKDREPGGSNLFNKFIHPVMGCIFTQGMALVVLE